MSAPRPFARAAIARAAAAALACAALAVLAPQASAAGAPGDSLVRSYVRSMADSTDQWFGLSAQPGDTTGTDSTLAFRLAHPRARQPRHVRVSLAPDLAFHRTLGAAYGADASYGDPRAWGRLDGTLRFANGPDVWLGSGTYALRGRARNEDLAWTLAVGGGRTAEQLDRDSRTRWVDEVGAFAFGNDRRDLLRRDGAHARFGVHVAGASVELGARSELESPLATTSTWTLFHETPVRLVNAAAAPGRANEFEAHVETPLLHTPFKLDARAWSAGGVLGGDLAYTRMRLALAGSLPAGRHFAFAPQIAYGRLTGSALPQDAFYLGGGSSLRTLDPGTLPGTGLVYAHADLISIDDVARLLGADRPSLIPIQVGAFAGTAARWGFDSATGAAAPTPRAWPDRAAWASEAGASLMYRPGLPEPDWFVRLDYAVPLGPSERSARFYVSYDRALGVLPGR